MAAESHKLAYYKELECNGSLVRLNIYQKTILYPVATRIGNVLTSLSYGIQGSDSSIDEPIQKTSLEFSLVDAPDCNTFNERNGNWEEFFTPDATGYKVELVIDSVVKWTGYITPDSWEEDLTYHMPVSIIARDNWGRLQDFMFDHPGDADNLISIESLLLAAAKKAEMPMRVIVNKAVPWPECNGIPLYSHMVNTRQFEGKSWWTALTDTLGSLGLTLTYEDNNTFFLAPLRSRVTKGNSYMPDVVKKEFLFQSSGHRSLSPAVREIVEVQTYEFSDDMLNAPELTINSYDAGATYPFTTQPYGVKELKIPVHSLASGGFWKQNESGYYSLFCNLDYKPKENDDKVRLTDGKTLFLATNPGTATDYSTAWRNMRGVYCEVQMTKMRANIQFSVGEAVSLYGAAFNTGTAPYKEEYTSPSIQGVRAKLKYIPLEGDSCCWNGQKWVVGDDYYLLMPPTSEGAVYTYEYEIPSANIDQPGILHLEFLCGQYIVRGEYDDDGKGMYMPITDLKLVSIWETEAENKVTTKYNDINNLIIERNPAIGCLNFDSTSPQEVLNGVYTPVYGRPASREWRWSDDDDKTYQLPVLIHKELLAYYSKANNVLTGEIIVDGLKSLPSFDCLWLWRGKEHILLSGRVNLLSGMMEGAELREFVRYGEMWQAHTNIDYFEIGYEGGTLSVRVIANDTTAWQISAPEWIMPSVTSGTGTKDITLYVEPNAVDRKGYVKIGPAVVKVVQKSLGDFNADYNEDFKHYRDFDADYDRKDLN